MPLVMLRKDWPTKFRRSIRDNKGKLTGRVLGFEPGETVSLTSKEIEAVQSDIGVSLMPIELDEKQRPRVIHDEVDVAEASNSEPTDATV